MKKFLWTTIVLTLFTFLLPLFLADRSEGSRIEVSQVPEETPVGAVEAVAPVEETGSPDLQVVIRIKAGETILERTLYDYLLGVVSAEMPGSYPIEALKAQAVAARTYTHRRMLDAENGTPAHEDADVCTDPAHCKAYVDFVEREAEWKAAGKAYAEKIREAVRSTSGEVLFYDGEPIVAVFHAASGEYTESAADVWGEQVDYLQSVQSPDGAEYERSITMKASEFKKLFCDEYPAAALQGPASGWFSNVLTSGAGGVISLEVGGVSLSGSSLRFLLGLPSANFDIRISGDSIRFDTTGYGHGVGLSQYGAAKLAEEGKTYQEILLWYYSGVALKKVG